MSGCEAKVPALRFKGHPGSWERKRLGDEVSFSKGKGYSKSDISATGMPLFLYGRLYTDYQAEVDDVDTFTQLQKGSVLSNGGEVVVPGSGETPEDIARASAILSRGIILGGDLNILTPKDLEETYSPFLALSLSNGRTSLQIADRAQGKTVVHIHNSDLENIQVAFPSLPEQRRIGTFFRSLDALIAGREKALEKLELLKKSMLLKMFPQGDATVPGVRFKGFAGDWEKKRLGDSFNLDVSTNTLSRAELSQTGMVRNVHYGDVLIKYGSIVDVSNEAIPFIADCQFKCDRKNKLMDGDVIMADTAEDETAGKVTEIRGIGDELLVSGLHTIVLRPNEKYGDGFLGYCLNAPGYHERLSSVMQGSKVLSINKGVLSDTDLLAPSLPEQQKIGAYFRSLDALLASRREEIEKLKQMKKALLERMFV